jgi:hypothetical protein
MSPASLPALFDGVNKSTPSFVNEFNFIGNLDPSIKRGTHFGGDLGVEVERI